MPGTASSTSPCDRVTLFPVALKQILTKLLTLATCLAPGYLAAQTPRFNIQDLGTLPNLPACTATRLSQSANVGGYCPSQSGQDWLANSPTTHVLLYANGTKKDRHLT